MVRRRMDDDGAAYIPTSPPEAGEWGRKYPEIWDFLVATSYDDGGERVPGSLVLFRDGPHVKGCLSDKDAELVAFVSGQSMEALLVAMEEGLAEDSLDWRAQRPARRK